MLIQEDRKMDVKAIRKEFPILKVQVNGKPLVYFDNAASSQKPQCVIDAISEYYSTYNSNVHRGVHHLSQVATTAYEEARIKIKNFINAKHSHEVIFTSGTTDSINLVAQTFGRKFIKEGDEIIISTLEHHSNIVPWQMLCEESGAVLRVIPITESGEIMMDEFEKLLSSKTKLVSVNHISNTLGTINPVKDICKLAHEAGAKVLIDGAQAAPHGNIDVQDIDCDFYTISAHKMYGPTGIGVLYGKEEILNEMPPWRGGGEMIKSVSFEKTEYNDLPHKFEAGTPHIEGGIVFGTAVDFMNRIGHENIKSREQELLEYGTQELSKIDGIKFYGTAKEKTAVISFLLEGIHPYDAGTIMDKLGVAVRTGHHCTEPLMDFYNIPGTIRASFAFYNTKEEIDIMIAAINRAIKMLR